ncbi:hypothetical protein AB0D49_21835 [Streptomyces sp. NPDC048290]|uniref:hypothetical protein n=1 Tax=Streptomyces sp. NPDC048290 TaxID=3155811 RepID=UPI0034319F3F
MSSAALHVHAGHQGHGHGGGGGRYLLELGPVRLAAGEEGLLRFRVVGDHAGRPVLTSYQEQHGKELHLIVASRDLTVYRHLHPVRGEGGEWTVSVALPKGGDYRVFADFRPVGGDSVTAGADLRVGGAGESAPLPPVDGVFVTDGYEVRLDGGLTAGDGGGLVFSVSKDGRPVTDLEPYLGAYGHLVALRAADLAYLHVHPDGEPGDGRTPSGPEVSFHATATAPGAHRLFLDFRHDGVVRTAAFTVDA